MTTTIASPSKSVRARWTWCHTSPRLAWRRNHTSRPAVSNVTSAVRSFTDGSQGSRSEPPQYIRALTRDGLSPCVRLRRPPGAAKIPPFRRRSVPSAAPLLDTRLNGTRPDRHGKVRDLFDLGDRLLLVATDRISAFDYVLGSGIPDKGKVLTQLSAFWFGHTAGLV